MVFKISLLVLNVYLYNIFVCVANVPVSAHKFGRYSTGDGYSIAKGLQDQRNSYISSIIESSTKTIIHNFKPSTAQQFPDSQRRPLYHYKNSEEFTPKGISTRRLLEDYHKYLYTHKLRAPLLLPGYDNIAPSTGPPPYIDPSNYDMSSFAPSVDPPPVVPFDYSDSLPSTAQQFPDSQRRPLYHYKNSDEFTPTGISTRRLLQDYHKYLYTPELGAPLLGPGYDNLYNIAPSTGPPLYIDPSNYDMSSFAPLVDHPPVEPFDYSDSLPSTAQQFPDFQRRPLYHYRNIDEFTPTGISTRRLLQDYHKYLYTPKLGAPLLRPGYHNIAPSTGPPPYIDPSNYDMSSFATSVDPPPVESFDYSDSLPSIAQQFPDFQRRPLYHYRNSDEFTPTGISTRRLLQDYHKYLYTPKLGAPLLRPGYDNIAPSTGPPPYIDPSNYDMSSFTPSVDPPPVEPFDYSDSLPSIVQQFPDFQRRPLYHYRNSDEFTPTGISTRRLLQDYHKYLYTPKLGAPLLRPGYDNLYNIAPFAGPPPYIDPSNYDVSPFAPLVDPPPVDPFDYSNSLPSIAQQFPDSPRRPLYHYKNSDEFTPKGISTRRLLQDYHKYLYTPKLRAPLLRPGYDNITPFAGPSPYNYDVSSFTSLQ